MKKIVLIASLVAVSTAASYSQGLVSINQTLNKVSTNTTASVTGAVDGNGKYAFELLFVNGNTTIASTANQLNGNAGNVAIWTDTGVSGANGFGLNRGKLVSGTSVSVASWTAPGPTLDNGSSFIIVGWSTADYGSTWAGMIAQLQTGLAAGGYFGTTAVSIGFAGGGASSLPAYNEWASVASGNLILQQVVATPEPGTIALAGLGGLSLLALRRKK